MMPKELDNRYASSEIQKKMERTAKEFQTRIP